MASLSQGRTAAAQCGLFTHKSVPVIFEPPCIKMAFQEVGCEGMDWIDVGKDRDRWRALVNVAMNIWVPLNVRIFLTS